MTEMSQEKRLHFILSNTGIAEEFAMPSRAIGENIQAFTPNRKSHGAHLLKQVQQLKETLSESAQQQKEARVEEGLGLQIEFESFSEVSLAVESLDKDRSGIELRNVRFDGEGKTFATVFVPDGKLDIFEKQINSYLDSSKDSKKGPKYSNLLNTIKDIRAATVKALWTDVSDLMPALDDEEIWWEVWLPRKSDGYDIVQRFRETAERLGFKVVKGELRFPERVVLQMYGSLSQMKSSTLILNSIAELRIAKETAEFFDSIAPREQHGWVEELSSRLKVTLEEDDVPYVCLLDTGVNNGHPLLKSLLAPNDLHTVEPSWGVNDQNGHGTSMAGVALFGDLSAALATDESIVIGHRLESVKLLPTVGSNGNDAVHHGYLTLEAVSRPRITAPNRKRLFSMAVTARDNRDRGRPSAWSASIDRLVFGGGELDFPQSLFIISAGNIEDQNAWLEYPASNETDSVHDPAQAWNALTVGAMTDLVAITEPDAKGYQPIAPEGGLSPFSTTSQTWVSHWPLKPDVVFEGGNAAKDSLSASWFPSLSLLTTHSEINKRLFSTANATSAATSAAARMAAQIMAHYSQLWPETVRGLIVHSAEWTPTMKAEFLSDRGQPSKASVTRLIRHCGFGVPSLERALWSLSNSLTLICEDSLYPFKREGSKEPTYNEMNLHALPWPLEELQSLGSAEVEMRVTLSYFIEPNPSARGVTSRYRYESHGLRFDVKRPVESESSFRSRINRKARDNEEYFSSRDSDSAWLVGPSGRHRGSIHSDIWKGTAADLASRGAIAIYPSSGWWKSRPRLERYDQSVRYSLIVSIRVPEVDVDLYTPIENQISTPIAING
ncbi:hypothetical protein GGR41_000826 [Paenalcaligenes hominis]|uniref:Peptidase S8/S53 domain-containing protein n=2 Tax=Paenalcaligenes hominis TaxID=643674 RepID=A0ABX0WPV0_9BURK|nr:hypothetical protein [Paenalcaligenes hominis]GGE60497.1 hypothetical protein GCM10007278_05930 [Paenalcaligenes hominis]